MSDSTRAGGLVLLLRRAGHGLLALPLFVVLLLCAGWMSLIWSLSSREGSDMPASGFWPVLSNAGHAFLFGILALLLAAALLRFGRAAGAWPRLTLARVVTLLLAVVAYGFVDEWHQSRVAGRSPSALDLLTDVVGAACVLWVIAYLGRGDAGPEGLRARLLISVVACLAAAVLGTLLPGL